MTPDEFRDWNERMGFGPVEPADRAFRGMLGAAEPAEKPGNFQTQWERAQRQWLDRRNP